MKKFLIVFSILIGITFFSSTFFSVGYQDYLKLNDASHYIFKDAKEIISVSIDEAIYNDNVAQKKLLDLVENNHLTLLGYERYKETESVQMDIYIYSEGNVFNGLFETKSGTHIDFSDSNENRYYGTKDLNDDNLIMIDLLNPLYYNSTTPVFYRPFHTAQGSDYPYRIVIKDCSDSAFLDLIQEKGLESYILDITIEDNQSFFLETNGIQFDPNGILNVVLILAFSVLTILFLTIIIKQKKSISVAMLHGYSKAKIIKKVFLSMILEVIISYMVTIILLLLIVAGPYRVTSKELYIIMFSSILGLCFIMLLVCIVMYFYLRNISSSIGLKQNKLNLFSIKLNIIIKIVMSLMLLTPFIELIPDCISQLKDTIALYKAIDVYEQRYKVNIVLSTREHLETPEKSEEIENMLYPILNEHNAEAYDAMNWYLEKEFQPIGEQANVESNYFHDIPYVEVNHNYIKRYLPLYYSNDEILNIDDLEGNHLLIPKKYKGSEAEAFYIDKIDAEVNYIEDLDYSLEPLAFNERKFFEDCINPIIYVNDDIDIGFYYIETNNLDTFHNYFKEQGIEKYISYTPMNVAIQDSYNKQFIIFSSTLFLLIGYLSVYLIFVYQCVFVYLDVYRRKLAVQYLQGYSYWKCYYEIYIINISAYIIAGIGSYLIFDTSIAAIISYVLFFGAIEAIFEAYQIHQFQTKETIQSLK